MAGAHSRMDQGTLRNDEYALRDLDEIRTALNRLLWLVQDIPRWNAIDKHSQKAICAACDTLLWVLQSPHSERFARNLDALERLTQSLPR
jgi:hypothetical protein